MRPIRQGDGTGISDVRLGDGTQIGEVRKGDGTVLWSAGSDIPEIGVSRWEFEQDLTDSWDNNPWTDQTSAGYSTNSAVGSYAKDFDGVNDDLVNGDIIPETGNWTLTTWAYPRALDGGRIYSTDPGAGTRGFQARVDTDGTVVLFTGNNSHTTTATVSANAYTFIGFAKNGTETTIDIGGSRQTFTTTYNDTTNPLIMGSFNSANGFWDGLFDDPRYYDKRLSATELDNLRTMGSI